MSRIEYLQDMSQELLRCRDEGILCDVVLIAENKSIRAHSVILAAASPLLRAYLLQSTDNPDNIQYLYLPEFDFDTVQIAVYLMYTGFLRLSEEYATDYDCEDLSKDDKRSVLFEKLTKLGLCEQKLKKCDVTFKTCEEASGTLMELNLLSMNKNECNESYPQLENLQMSETTSDTYADIVDVNKTRKVKVKNNTTKRRKNCAKITRAVATESPRTTGDETYTCSLLLNSESDSLLVLSSQNHSNNNYSKEISADVTSKDDDNKPCEIIRGVLRDTGQTKEGTDTEMEIGKMCDIDDNTAAILVKEDHEAAGYDRPVTKKCFNSRMKQSLEKFSCPHCAQKFSYRWNMLLHVAKHDLRPDAVLPKPHASYNCEICKKLLRGPQDLANHKRIHTGEKPWSCSDCGQAFSWKRNFDRHRILHGSHRPYYCELCGKGFIQKQQLVDHMTIHHSKNRVWKCAPCLLTFDSRPEFKQHCALTHAGVRPCTLEKGAMNEVNADAPALLCEMCGKSFLTTRAIAIHIRTHSTTDELTCDTCQMVCATKRCLDIHRNLHNIRTDRPFACTQCKQTFVSKGSLNAHCMRRHRTVDNVDPVGRTDCGSVNKKNACGEFPCSKCDKVCNSSHALMSHFLVHTDERQFQCNICDKKFAYASALKVHTLIHEDKRPYICSVCGHSFRQLNHVKNHVLAHNGIKPYPCQMCAKSYRNRLDLRYHYTRFHHLNVDKKTFNRRSTYTVNLPANLERTEVEEEIDTNDEY